MMRRKLHWTKDGEARLADERLYFTTKKVNQWIGFFSLHPLLKEKGLQYKMNTIHSLYFSLLLNQSFTEVVSQFSFTIVHQMFGV